MAGAGFKWPPVKYGTEVFDVGYRVCANPDVNPETVRRECTEECSQHFSGIDSFYVGASCNLNQDTGENQPCEVKKGYLAYASATCKNTEVYAPLTDRCFEADKIYNPVVYGQYGLSLEAGSYATVTVDGESGSAPLSGRLAYMLSPDPRLAPCPEEGCPVAITGLSFTAPNFEIDGVPVTGVRLNSPALVQGTWYPNGTFTIPAGNFRLQANFTIDGKRGSQRVIANRPVTGRLDPFTDTFVLDRTTFSGSDFAAAISFSAKIDGHPPVVAIDSAPTQLECLADRTAPATFSAVADDVEGDVVGLLWRQVAASFETVIGDDSQVTATLPLGMNIVEVFAFDARLGYASDATPVRVVDTTAPTLTPTGDTVVVCDPVATNLAVPLPDIFESCTPDAVVLTGEVFERDGVPLAQPIPILDGRVTLSPATYSIRWTATDESDNATEIIQSLTVVAQPTLYSSRAATLSDRSSVLFQGQPIGTVANRGTGEVNLGADGRSGSLLSVGRVFLRERSVVDGRVVTASTLERQANAQVLGLMITGSAPILPAQRTLSVTFPTLQGDINVAPGAGPVPLAPGAYGSVTVFSSATLVLSAGDYYFRRFQVEPHAVVRLDKAGGTIRVFVRDDVIYRGNLMHSDGSPGGFFLGYTGQNAIVLESPFQGAVVAPNSQLTLGGNSPMAFTGQFTAMDINLRADVSVHHRAFECSNP